MHQTLKTLQGQLISEKVKGAQFPSRGFNWKTCDLISIIMCLNKSAKVVRNENCHKVIPQRFCEVHSDKYVKLF